METNILMDEVSPTQEVYFAKPSLIVRIKTTFIDMIVVIGLLFIVNWLIQLMNLEAGIIQIILFSLVFMYEPFFTSFNRSLGQRVMGMRVRKFNSIQASEHPKNINIAQSLLRYIVKGLLGWISLLTIHSNDYGKAIHDNVSLSVMTLEK